MRKPSKPTPAPTKGAHAATPAAHAAAPTAPTVATVATAKAAPAAPAPTLAAPVALPVGGNCAPLAGARPAVPVALAAGALASLPCTGGYTATVAVPLAASYSTATPPAWPPLYTRNAGTVAVPPGAPRGAASYTVPALLRHPTAPARWGVAHVYPGHTVAGVAGSPGCGTMVAVAGPVGAVLHGCTATGTLATLATTVGL